jgi:hypothetical protein
VVVDNKCLTFAEVWAMKPTAARPRISGIERVLLRVMASLFVLSGILGTASVQAEQLQGQALIRALKNGGFSIYFRHEATDWTQQDKVNQRGDWLSCDPRRMRQLSPQGRLGAGRTGEAIRALGIPVGRVYASPYCRTMDTARQLKLGAVTPSDGVMNLRVAEYFGGRSAIVTRAQALLATPPTNR